MQYITDNFDGIPESDGTPHNHETSNFVTNIQDKTKAVFEKLPNIHTFYKTVVLSALLGFSHSASAGYELNGFYIWKMDGETYSISLDKDEEIISWKEARKHLMKANFNVSDILKKKIIAGESSWNKNEVGINTKNKKEKAKVDACFMQINSQHYLDLEQKNILNIMHLWVGDRGSESRVLTKNVDDIFKPEVCAKAAKLVLKKHGGDPYTAWYALNK